MSNDDLDYAALRRRVEVELQQERRKRQLVLFLLSGFIFLLFLIVMLMALPDSTDFLNRDSVLSVVYFLSAGWIIALVFHALSTFLINSPGWARKMRRRLTAQVFEEMQFDQEAGLVETLTPKNKHQPASRLRLSDDGDLLEIVEDGGQDDKAKREGRYA